MKPHTGGAWDAEDCALLLMDYQDNVLGTIFEQDRRVIELNVSTRPCIIKITLLPAPPPPPFGHSRRFASAFFA